MKLSFTKMHGLGNDFIVLDFTQHTVSLTQEQIKKISDRRFGIGCDQILIVEQSKKSHIDFRYRIINADGSEVGQCGNGSRCFAKFVHDNQLSSKNPITVETLSGVLTLDLNQKTGLVTVDMGVPNFEPSAIPIDSVQQKTHYTLPLKEQNQVIRFSAVSIGNPHCVIQVDDINTAPVETLGAVLESHPFFPEKCNVGFMQILNSDEFALRVFERGVGETYACGSGACATAAVAIRDNLVNHKVRAHLNGGTLELKWLQSNQAIMMTGAAEKVFTGMIEL